ncbi:methyltransferase [archaeon]|nr:methyltransferase [archaeon]MBL7057179.1 methyltransferase [Candidatus Woesearchaeota archaeon]
MNFYEAREDSFLLQKQIKNYAKGFILDMGTGSGIQAEEAAKFSDKVLAVDINEKAIKHCEKKLPRIEFRQSNLFSNITENFDLIVFNPPYLPNEPRAPDIALDGGKEGYELIGAFLKQAKEHLNEDGTILLLFSSFSKKEKIINILKEENYKYKEIAREHIEFEDLYVYEIKWTKNS